MSPKSDAQAAVVVLFEDAVVRTKNMKRELHDIRWDTNLDLDDKSKRALDDAEKALEPAITAMDERLAAHWRELEHLVVHGQAEELVERERGRGETE